MLATAMGRSVNRDQAHARQGEDIVKPSRNFACQPQAPFSAKKRNLPARDGQDADPPCGRLFRFPRALLHPQPATHPRLFPIAFEGRVRTSCEYNPKKRHFYCDTATAASPLDTSPSFADTSAPFPLASNLPP